MKKLVIILLVVCPALMVFSQDNKEEAKFGISFSGYVKNDFFWDTRQTVAAREGHFLLWPSADLPDANGDDINSKANFNMLSLQSRLSGKISGPDALGAKTSGLIEADFFAQANDNINLLRMRHAFLKLSWPKTELLTGQYWNPLFVTGCFPGTVSFNTGTPLQSFARNPQIRLTQTVGSFKLIGALLAQRDYSTWCGGSSSSSYLRNSAIPEMHFQVQYKTKLGQAGNSLLTGAAISYKHIVPRLSSTGTDDLTYKVDESVSSMAIIGYANLKLKPVTIKVQGRYGENISDVLSISGFALKEVTDPLTGEASYTPLMNSTVWAEIHTNGKKIQVGVFGGLLHNMGTKEAMSSPTNTIHGLAANIETLVRVSPRAIYNAGKVRFAFELEYTSASYGSGYDVNYVPATTNTVANVRTLLSTYYFF